MPIYYAHTKIHFNPISNFSDICERNSQNPRNGNTHPRESGMGKNNAAECQGLVFNKSRFSP